MISLAIRLLATPGWRSSLQSIATGPACQSRGVSSIRMRTFAIALGLSLILGCSPHRLSQGRQVNLCMTNMMAICFEVRYWNFNGDSFPPSLGSLAVTNPPSYFVCPCSGHTPGLMTNVEAWTDYIYLSGTHMDSTALLDVATLICPPENHGGQFGHVLWGGGWMERLPADKIRALIKEPWCMPTRARGKIGSEYLRTNTTLHVPERFRNIYPEWHYAYPKGDSPSGHYGRS